VKLFSACGRFRVTTAMLPWSEYKTVDVLAVGTAARVSVALGMGNLSMGWTIYHQVGSFPTNRSVNYFAGLKNAFCGPL
jgi:hypothetical protein